MPLTERQRAERRRAREIILDPALFSRHLLRHDVWSTPAAVMRAVRDHRRVAVKACHASSKTFTAADVVLWWFSIDPQAIAITTAPTWTQVERMMWGEIHKAIEGSRIKFPELRTTELKKNKNNFAIGISTNQGVRFQGWHGRVLIVVDEAPGVQADIWEAMEGVRAGGDVRILALGNPTMTGGPFYDAFHNERAGWKTFTIDGLDTPNTWGCGSTPDERLANIIAHGDAGDDAYLDANPRPYLITRRYIYEKYHEWGPGDPRFESRVRGRFPTDAENAVFPLSWIERNSHLPVERGLDRQLTAGVDVAGPGEDETVLYVRRGFNIVGCHPFSQADARGPVAQMLMQYGGPSAFDHVHVDENGIGYYFNLHLRDLGYNAHGINVGETLGVDTERFANLKAQLYWGVREALERNEVRGLRDEETMGQMASVRWSQDPRGRIVIESKREMLERGLSSPDRAEGLILCYAPPPRIIRPPAVPPTVSYRNRG